MIMDIINIIFTLISGVCVLVSINEARKSLNYAKTAKLIADRDDLKATFDLFKEIFDNLRTIRKIRNPMNQSRGKNPILKISSCADIIQTKFELLIKNIPSNYSDCLREHSYMKSYIGGLISESNINLITDERLDKIDGYFTSVQDEIKKIYSQKTKELGEH